MSVSKPLRTANDAPRLEDGTRVLDTRISVATVARIRRLLRGVFGPEVPYRATAELYRVLLEIGLSEAEYRLGTGRAIVEVPEGAERPVRARDPQSTMRAILETPGGIEAYLADTSNRGRVPPQTARRLAREVLAVELDEEEREKG
jgi:hypothetical protein